MNVHPDDARLRAFVAGEIADDEAVHLALHLDGCPRCAARADALDPLATAFAAVPEPPLPRTLLERVLAAIAAPSISWRAAVAGGAMLAAAAFLFILTFDPWDRVFATMSIIQAIPGLDWWAGAPGLGLLIAGALFLGGTAFAYVTSSRRVE